LLEKSRKSVADGLCRAAPLRHDGSSRAGCARGIMKALVSVLIAVAAAAPASAGTIERSLARLDPLTRLEQICSIEALVRVDHDNNPYRPDRAVIYALSKPQIDGDTLSGEGGALRSQGKWYQFSFRCQSTADHMHVTKFTYKLGKAIPQDKWQAYGLWE
jgi:hypothetical protein